MLKTQYYIRAPIWNGGKRCVGLAESRLQGDLATFEILYEDKHGDRIYPNQFKVSTRKVAHSPVQFINGTKLRVVPLEDCEEVLNG